MVFGIPKHIYCEFDLLEKRARGLYTGPLNDNLRKNVLSFLHENAIIQLVWLE